MPKDPVVRTLTYDTTDAKLVNIAADESEEARIKGGQQKSQKTYHAEQDNCCQRLCRFNFEILQPFRHVDEWSEWCAPASTNRTPTLIIRKSNPVASAATPAVALDS